MSAAQDAGVNRSGGMAAPIFCERAFSPARLREVQAPGARNSPAVEIDHTDGPHGIEQYIVCIQVRMIDACAVQARDRRADSAPHRRCERARRQRRT